MNKRIERISIQEIRGFRLGTAESTEGATGVTAILCEDGATAGVDVRGGAPATRETDLLKPENMVQKIHAVCLSGGSAFGEHPHPDVHARPLRSAYGADDHRGGAGSFGYFDARAQVRRRLLVRHRPCHWHDHRLYDSRVINPAPSAARRCKPPAMRVDAKRRYATGGPPPRMVIVQVASP